MVLEMIDARLKNIADVKRFLKESGDLEFRRKKQNEAYEWLERLLERFGYFKQSRKNKTVIKRYIEKMTGYSRAQVTRLAAKCRETGKIEKTEYERHKFEKKYNSSDIRLLADTSDIHDHPNGAALKRNLTRMAIVYGQKEYEKIAEISVSHIYNLRKTVAYRRAVSTYNFTKKNSQVSIGDRRKPQPDEKPGYIRVDSVHQGDTVNADGVYHINTVDETVQFEVVGAAERLTKKHLLPLLLKIIKQYPFRIINFHADNGSEYINKYVAQLLNELLISLTKSRPRHSNDNALVETKNGWVIRKWIGYGHIGQKYANELNRFYFGCFNEYINFHRPCAFPTHKKDKKGKTIKVYRTSDYMTPYEKLKSLPYAEKYLKVGITFEKLDIIAMRYTDNEMAMRVQEKRSKLFERILQAA